MAEYIEREAALSHPFANGHYDHEHAPEDFILGYESYKEWLEQLPVPDVVEVVRCKDCKYRYDDDFCGGRGWPEQLVPDDGYCNNGAIKDGGV